MAFEDIEERKLDTLRLYEEARDLRDEFEDLVDAQLTGPNPDDRTKEERFLKEKIVPWVNANYEFMGVSNDMTKIKIRERSKGDICIIPTNIVDFWRDLDEPEESHSSGITQLLLSRIGPVIFYGFAPDEIASRLVPFMMHYYRGRGPHDPKNKPS